MDDIENARYVNELRKTRLFKSILTNSKMKERAKYQLTDNENMVDPHTIVFESFGGKITVIVQSIYMNICNNTIHNINIFGSFLSLITILFLEMQLK